MEPDDLMQDAFLLYLHLVEHYPRVINPRHFMALYKTSFSNLISTKARQNILRKEIMFDLDDDIYIYADTIQGNLDNQGFLLAMVGEMAPELRAVLSLFNDERKLKKLREPLKRYGRDKYGKFSGVKREKLTEKFARLIGQPAGVDAAMLVSDLKQWLKEGNPADIENSLQTVKSS